MARLPLALWLGLAALSLQAPPGPELPPLHYGENVIDLLEALNVTRSVRGVSRAAGPEPGVPAWKFRQRVPHLTLPWDYAVYLLASSQGALGFHFVARQSRGSAGTLISLVSPAAATRDGRPLLQLASSARANQLRLDYRAEPSMEPASLLFPGGSPFARGRWARLAVDLQPHRLALFVDCRPAVLLERGGPRDTLSLLLPLDLQITFASLPGDAASKFLGYWQTAEISPSGFPRRPWHCENLAEPPALADIRNYQQQPGEPEFPPPGALEERVQQLEELVDGFGAMLDMVKAQSSELLARVKSLESCECRRPACVWEGTQREDGATWDKDDCTTCICLQGEVRCSARQDRPQCLGCEYDGQRYQDRDVFLAPSNSCMNCSCLDGNVQCFRLVCPQLHCATQEEVPGACCPRCQGCVDGAARREHGEEWAPRADPCQSCRCLDGRAVCRKRQCARLCRHPASPRPGTCCPVCDGCSLDGREFASGEPVPSGEPCTQCACLSGNVLCKPTGCPAAPCSEPVRRPGECCPRCQDCLYDAQPVPHGAVFTPPQEPCLHCRCQAGEVSCERLEQSCPPTPCSHPGTAQGQCCPACHTCEYEGHPYRHGETFMAPGHGPCVRCTCSAGHVQCQEEGCPPVPCAQPIRDPQRCCPICKVCVLAGEEFEEGAQWEPDGDPCTTCTCLAGEPVCGAPPCPPIACQHPARLSGDCCPTCAQCAYHQHVYANGQTFADPHSPCQHCQCTAAVWRGPRWQRASGSPARGTPASCASAPTGSSAAPPATALVPCAPAPCPAPAARTTAMAAATGGRSTPTVPSSHTPRTAASNATASTAMFSVCHGAAPPCSAQSPSWCPAGAAPSAQSPRLAASTRASPTSTRSDSTTPRTPAATASVPTGPSPASASLVPPFSAPTPCGRTAAAPVMQDSCLLQQEHLPTAPAPRLCSCPALVPSAIARSAPRLPVPGEGAAQRGAVPGPRGAVPHLHLLGGQRLLPAQGLPAAPVPLPCPGAVLPGCEYLGEGYLDGQEFPDPQDACGRCACLRGFVTCTKTPCDPPGCRHPTSPPGKCCPVCQGCHFQGQDLADGETFPAPGGRCEQCRCLQGEVSCGPLSCPGVKCSHPAVGPCDCPMCDGCSFHGRACSNGERFPDPHDACRLCSCLDGSVTCVPAPCSPAPCRNPVNLPGQCCPQCSGTCHYQGHLYESGTTFRPPAGDPCSTCTCLDEAVTCQREPCLQQCTHPVPPAAPSCCPDCNRCLFEGQELASRQAVTPPSDPCQRCRCLHGNVLCTPVLCPQAACASPVRRPGHCCPECPVCRHGGQEYPEGSHWPSPTDPCQRCSCAGGDVLCVKAPCPPLTCTHQVIEPGDCCPRCKGCMYDGQEHANGTSWFSSPCVSCLCTHGIATCAQIRCLGSCLRPVQVPGECCPLCADCVFEGRPYSPGESFQPSLDPCEICTCELLAAGGLHVRCYHRQCPSLVGCPRSQIQPPGPHHCCPTCAQALSNCTAELAGNELQVADDPCYTCQCKDLTWVCVRQGCPQLSCPLAEQFTPQGTCCPVCDECVVETGGRRVSDGESWTDSEGDCVSCTCNRGHVECHIAECEPVECQGGLRKVQMPGSCCYECQDPDGSCSYQGQQYQASEHWQVDTCTACTCVSGEVHCRSQRCPPPACAADETPALTPGMCCPHCLPRPATCLAFGDPHYRTFDGRLLHFQGTCTYVLAQDCQGGDFSIHVTNDDRGRPGVAWTKEVTVRVGDVVVQLMQDWLVRVDGQVVTLPFLKEPHLYVERQTNTVLLNTNIGVKVLWSGRSQLEVSVPGTYKGHMCGLCGDFNGHPQDDARLRSGQLARAEAAFGNSWRVQNGNGTGGPCADGQDVDPCKEAGYRARKEANARCKVLKSGAFEPCHPLVPPEPFFAACVYDLCACGAGADQCLCDALEAYAALCRRAGLALRWRSPTLCAVGCPQDRGYVFDECGPPCPKTCYNKDAPLGAIESRCFTPCVPGCQCPAGRVEHESHCILPEACPQVVYGNL
ncbi:kielin/chordin-like protein isoform X3 [Malaclemys terrapin pileata]|uniref:kielin/chordin-like protein isoform X3 n=1 Tax=Malaclemys terrapin pileata TaxID=2991368 RepID=UPI0023A866F3|nr:kielin/chordin-like protein isoform X3 [Malaclemys terrapin pileata]